MPPPYSCTRVRVSAVAGTTSTISPSAVRRTITERPSSSGRISTQNSSPAAACSQPRAMPDSAMRRAVSGEAQEPYDAMARCPWAAPDRAPSVTRAPREAAPGGAARQGAYTATPTARSAAYGPSTRNTWWRLAPRVQSKGSVARDRSLTVRPPSSPWSSLKPRRLVANSKTPPGARKRRAVMRMRSAWSRCTSKVARPIFFELEKVGGSSQMRSYSPSASATQRRQSAWMRRFGDAGGVGRPCAAAPDSSSAALKPFASRLRRAALAAALLEHHALRRHVQHGADHGERVFEPAPHLAGVDLRRRRVLLHVHPVAVHVDDQVVVGHVGAAGEVAAGAADGVPDERTVARALRGASAALAPAAPAAAPPAPTS